ncbi:Hint domain-containing protein [Methylobacterium thuringiense]|uniref:Hedgehog/Intein (Hint) domain-containing protein n=1 Tax=Methylobacterium thuringiense TaxID=1003091 RepID=A0ABQ4TH85_9HYPH|nr:Hint domain-containing protein [Methylobacterium thuringiense]GJE54189.1 hypothetical protein EKPJFOCH_0662 [Methylobacterium thuringiense]
MTKASTAQDATAMLAMRTALASGPLLGFDTSEWAGDGVPRAKQAFVGTLAPTRTVISTADTGQGTLREALQNQVDGLVINFDPSLAGQTIQLEGNLSITEGVTINGAIGNSSITISGTAATNPNSSQPTAGIFNVRANQEDTVTLRGLNLTNGKAEGVPSIGGTTGGSAGGAIRAASGSLVLENITFSNNTAVGGRGNDAQDTSSGDPDKAAGNGGNAAGAVYVESRVTVAASNLVFSNNSGFAGSGGAASLASPEAGLAGTGDQDSNSQTVRDAAVCYASGTRILTAAGEVAVENLTVGDLAATASGAYRPIRWIGHRTSDCRSHPAPQDILPVRISAGAFGENRPARDLVVSPGHSICLDVLGEVLIPASALVNGTTITQQDVETVTYWHIELESHDILIAEGQLAESYLDMGNRGFFAESSVVDLGATPDVNAAARTHADFCRPYVADGVVLDAVRAQVQARAEQRGWRLDDAPWADMHLMVDGVRVEADTHGLTARFVLPAEAKDVWLISETSAPSQISNNRDPRQLGLCIQGITIDDGVGEKRSVALDDPLLCVGFHDCEDGVRRWTAGRSRLPAKLFAGCRGTVFLRLDLVRPALPRWVAPQAAVVEPAEHEAPRLSLVA